VSPSTVPSFDDAVITLLGLLGVSSGILMLVGIAFALHSWVEGLRQTLSLATTVGRAAGRAGRTLVSLPPIRAVVTVLITALVPIAQCLTVGLCFVAGNYVAISFDDERWRSSLAAYHAHGESWLDREFLAAILKVDGFSGGYALFAMILLSASYSMARRTTRTDDLYFRLGIWLAAPGSLLLVASGAVLLTSLVIGAGVGVLILVFSGGGAALSFLGNLRLIVPLAAGFLICLLYCGACQAAVRGSRLVIRAWRRDDLDQPPGMGNRRPPVDRPSRW
jgi:hypothetical protein